MNGTRRIYLDHAATSWPKSDRVVAAMMAYIQDCGAAAGRGSYMSAHRAGEILYEMRSKLAYFLGAESRQCISLHGNCTLAINAALHGLLRPGDHVVTTAAEHNSVLRPLEFAKQHRGVDVTVVACNESGQVTASDVLAAVRPTTRMVAICHASNVTGVMQPISELGEELRDTPTLLLCDAAQTFGYVPISVRKLGVDILAIPGHKGGGGPLGTGALYLEGALQEEIVAHIQGGTGFLSESLEMPQDYPAKLEAGNANVPGFAGWLAAMTEWNDDRQTTTEAHMRALSKSLRDSLRSVPRLRVVGSDDESLPVVSVTLEDLAPVDVSTILDSDYGIETRAGIHCAALVHEHLGTSGEGTLRISAGLSTTEDDIDAVVNALSEITAEVAL